MECILERDVRTNKKVSNGDELTACHTNYKAEVIIITDVDRLTTQWVNEILNESAQKYYQFIAVPSARRDERKKIKINNSDNDDVWHKNSYKYFCVHMFTFFCLYAFSLYSIKMRESTVKLLLHCYWLPASMLLYFGHRMENNWRNFFKKVKHKTKMQFLPKTIFSLKFAKMKFFCVEKWKYIKKMVAILKLASSVGISWIYTPGYGFGAIWLTFNKCNPFRKSVLFLYSKI